MQGIRLSREGYMSFKKWSDQETMKIVTNPVYTGIGWFPKLAEEEVFIGAVKSVIKENGLRHTLTVLRYQLHAPVG